jgi:predicted AAA+ superfamily ATPase
MIDLIEKSKQLVEWELFSRKYYLQKLKILVNNRNMLVITGQRRVWKSYIILDYLKTKKIDLNEVFYINKELDSNSQIKDTKDLNKFFTEYEKDNDIKYIIIDEIQDINEWEIFVREKLAYKKYNIIITGSNSKLLSGELATYLAWRYLTLEVFPFTYSEYLEFKSLENTKENFKEYLKFGWMPEILLWENSVLIKNYTKSLINSIILKDIIARYKVWEYALFEKVLIFLAQNIWSLTTLRKIDDFLKKDKLSLSLQTISNYTKYLQNTFILNEAQRYDILGKKVLEFNSKYYFNDLWIRNAIYLNFDFDISKLLENYVYNTLLKNWYKISVGNIWWLEIDFVAEKDDIKKYFQVCYLLATGEIYKREFWNLEKINDNWEKYVVSMDDIIFKNSKWVKHIQAWEIEKYL